jgi:ATP-dependent exoDNAse (exonuclease V) beta subunit
VIHAWFEHIEWLDDPPPDAQTLQQIARDVLQQCGDVIRDTDALADEFAAMIAKPAVRASLCRSAYANLDALDISATGGGTTRRLEVQNERVFAVQLDGEVLTGSIDRLVLVYDGDQLVAADVLDYKTDAVASQDDPRFEERVEHYRPQIQAYCRAVSQMTGLPDGSIGARLLFVGPGIVAPIATA